jgi:nucleotide-binding universal stress UspA family protein
MEFRNLLVATDFSEHADSALDCAIALATTFEAKIHLVHAFDVPLPFVSPYEVAIPDSYLEATREEAIERLAAREEKVKSAGVAVEAHLAEVPAAPAIADAAEEIGADLIVMGTRGHTGLKHVLLGSVADRTLRLAPCSVLTVKKPERSEDRP